MANGCSPRLMPLDHSCCACSQYGPAIISRCCSITASFAKMEVPRDSMLLRIFIGESDRFNHKPLYETIVLKARELHLGGATVLRGPMGFGKSSRMHTAKILRLSMDLPLVIEIVDSGSKERPRGHEPQGHPPRRSACEQS